MALKAHTGFSVPETTNLEGRIADHFESLGYDLRQESSVEWVFHRGNKLSALWRFDIRAYDTTLTVRADRQTNGDTWVSCDWEVYTFMSITNGGDVATLEAEGRSLESALRRTA